MVGDSLCKVHRAEKNRQRERARGQRVDREKKSRLYNYAYRKAAAQIRATATHCHICGEAFTDTDTIEADHIIPGLIDGPLAAAHRLCNQRRGAKPL